MHFEWSLEKSCIFGPFCNEGLIVLKNTVFGKIGEIFVRTAQPAF